MPAAPPPVPVNSAPPTISGTPVQGQTLTESHGTWSNSPTSYSYQWQTCDSTGTTCAPIVPAATGQTYTLTSTDVGHTISVIETATNIGGPGTGTPATPTALISAPPVPVNSAPPTISGTPVQGQTLTESHGTWSNSPTSYSYQWQTCDSTGTTCAPITPAATGQTYTLTSTDVGHTISVIETATNIGGPGTGTPATPTALISAPPVPVNSAPPTISGTPVQGQTLTESHGTWSNSPTSYSYQWQTCDSTGTTCAPITPAATGQTYTLTSTDVGHTISVIETATNIGGPGTGTPATPTALISAPPVPVNSAPPTISGTPVQGQTLTESHGTWSNSPTSYSYQWQTCDSTGTTCASITPAATGQTYTLTSTDVGHTISVIETATNIGGPGTGTPATPTALISAPPVPVNSAPPTISGTPVQGQTLTESHGTWSNSPTSYSYQWQTCDSTGTTCAPITPPPPARPTP